MGKAREQWTTEDYRASTEEARRAARFRHATNRIRSISEGDPPLTGGQRAELASLLCPEVADHIRAVLADVPPPAPAQLADLRALLGYSR